MDRCIMRKCEQQSRANTDRTTADVGRDLRRVCWPLQQRRRATRRIPPIPRFLHPRRAIVPTKATKNLKTRHLSCHRAKPRLMPRQKAGKGKCSGPSLLTASATGARSIFVASSISREEDVEMGTRVHSVIRRRFQNEDETDHPLPNVPGLRISQQAQRQSHAMHFTKTTLAMGTLAPSKLKPRRSSKLSRRPMLKQR